MSEISRSEGGRYLSDSKARFILIAANHALAIGEVEKMGFKYLIVPAFLTVFAFADCAGAQTVTDTIDGLFVWFQKGLDPANPNRGLPAPGVINGLGNAAWPAVQPDASSTFLLQPYTGNNALLLKKPGLTAVPPGVQSGTMTFATPTPASSLAIMATAGYGYNAVTATVHFSDGAPDVTSPLIVPDWASVRSDQTFFGTYGGTYFFPAAVVAADAVHVNPEYVPLYFQGTSSTIFDLGLPLGLDAPHPVTSVDFSWFAIRDNTSISPTVAIFGISTSTTASGPYSYAELTPSSFDADLVVEAPEPTYLGILTLVAILGVRRRRRRA